MGKFRVIVIDVGWGDSILLEYEKDDGNVLYAMVDSNDSKYEQNSFMFLKKRLSTRYEDSPYSDPLFEFVLLSHDHKDHAQGLKKIMMNYSLD